MDKGSSHTKILANAEVGRVRSNNPRELPPMDFISGYFYAGNGLNKAGYDPFVYATSQQLTGVGSFEGTGTTSYVPPALNPFVSGQDYHYIWPGPNASLLYNAQNGALLQSMTTFNGAKDVNGNSMSSFPQAAALYTTGFTNYAMTMNYLNPKNFPGAYAGTVNYNNKSLADPSIFNFYDNLIDGPNKQEWQNWKAFNVTVDESILNGRIAVQGIIDHQEFDSGSVDLYGYTEPFISVDLDANTIQYPSWYPSQAVANSNEGRAFTASHTGSGASSAHYDHDNYQVTPHGDLRSEDFLLKGLLTKILGHHSFTALFGDYKTTIENRAWDTYATDTAFANAMGDPTGSILILPQPSVGGLPRAHHGQPEVSIRAEPQQHGQHDLADQHHDPELQQHVDGHRGESGRRVDGSVPLCDEPLHAGRKSRQLCRLDVYAGQHPQLAERHQRSVYVGDKDPADLEVGGIHVSGPHAGRHDRPRVRLEA